MITVSVFFDFSKAFDCVSHSRLLAKLRNMRLSSSVLRWFHSYLRGRSQAVRDPSGRLGISAFVDMNAGVPQGSILGPMLFSLFLTDFGTCVSHCKYGFYADDLLIYLHCHPREIETGINKINEDIVRIVEWSERNMLFLNPSKTNAMILGTSRYTNHIDIRNIPGVEVAGVMVPFVGEVKYLGVTISSGLSWDSHVGSVLKKVNKTLYQLKLHRDLLPTCTRRNLVSALIFPTFDYCCTVLTDIAGNLDLKLQRALNSCVRFILNVGRREHITQYFNELSWLKIADRRRYFVASLLFNILHNSRPSYLRVEFRYRCDQTERETRGALRNLDVVIPQCRTEMYNKSFRSAAAILWNRLSTDLRSVEAVGRFRNEYYNFLLDGQMDGG